MDLINLGTNVYNDTEDGHKDVFEEVQKTFQCWQAKKLKKKIMMTQIGNQ